MKNFALFSLILSTLLIFRAGSISIQNKNDFLGCLNSQIDQNSTSKSLSIHTPKSVSFSSILNSTAQNLRASKTSTLKPVAIITPLDESQIPAAIYCSRKCGIQIRIRSGGHDYEGLSYKSEIPFVIIDMRNFRSVSVDTREKTAWVQTGTTIGQLYYAIAQVSRTLAFPAGVCPTVGVGGHFSGGGYGMISRKHGIAADHIIDARLINADGRILDRETMGDDLFWAIRGGGGTSFGILIAFKVKLVDIPEIVTAFNVVRTLEQIATELVHRWQYVADKIDDNLLIRVIIKSVNSPETAKRTIRVAFASLFLRRADDLIPLMAKEFPELGLVKEDCIEMSWIESAVFFPGFPANTSPDALTSRVPGYRLYFKAKSDLVRQPIPVDGLTGIWKFLNEEDESHAEIEFSPYGGRLNDFPETEIPFPHRSGNIFMIHYNVGWRESEREESDRHLNWIRRLYSYIASYVSSSPRAAYFNYRDLDIGTTDERNTSYRQASIWGFKYFKSNFNRLVRVKLRLIPPIFLQINKAFLLQRDGIHINKNCPQTTSHIII